MEGNITAEDKSTNGVEILPTEKPPEEEVISEMIEKIMSSPIEHPRTYIHELDYRNKLVLAPMVRTGSLPTRLLSLYYGAGLVWSPEVVDRAIIGSERIVDPVTGVITYTKGQGPIFSTHPMEKPYLIFQIGSSNPALAVKAAQTVQQDVSGIDLNCGCPKPFSTHSGMGAALLSTPDLLLDILRSLLQNIPLPISCKIRLLPTQPSTLVLAAQILRTGIRNLTVHCRTRNMRSGERAMWERLADVVNLGRRRDVSIICNGDGEGWSNWERIRQETGADSVMLARAAEKNPSIFRVEGPVGNLEEVVPRLLNIAQYTANPWGNTKFLLSQFKPSSPPVSNMTKAEKKLASEAISQSKSVEQAAEKLGIPLGRGKEVVAEIRAMIEERDDYNIWLKRTEAERMGVVVDEPTVVEPEVKVNGCEVGVGQADVEKHGSEEKIVRCSSHSMITTGDSGHALAEELDEEAAMNGG
ncbi:hypothetical protein TREMEDRAFT_42909 [Tremella mesenterica DSM 1558]|uniref:uncharacterized protein n=1 Tax=Tremella mesenterica (strain ATCC 24925 / CBS 8224 / DSM 1558 / NBRC 9311 / NRRL Y-6157 / RJB 2259-6 / UBC 559-6) TaxID=578456 RepID=UPI0003F4905B|nr:uncharacterized protein TREMEDRAFT_42909 [Tremella mesenterica DSM 1558]EIW71544.1 hypothetical protein TREMEDRAFT_42909 [Tremella mesenterica DSM 1558]